MGILFGVIRPKTHEKLTAQKIDIGGTPSGKSSPTSMRKGS
jgi:hypothetical protein